MEVMENKSSIHRGMEEQNRELNWRMWKIDRKKTKWERGINFNRPDEN